MISRNTIVNRILVAVLIFSFSFLSYGCSYTNYDMGSLEVLHEKTFNTSPGKNFTLKAFSGDVYVTTTDEPTVYVKILGNEQAKKKVKFKFENTSEGVTVITKRTDDWSLFHFGRGVALKFEIKLPKNYNANISSSGGDIELKDLNGKMELSSSGGDISVKNSDGSLFASTSGGDIHIDNIQGDQKLTTSGGDISSSGFNGNLKASTSGGDVYLKGSNGKIDASTSGGEINLAYTGENMGIKLFSSGGDISVKLPKDFNAHADLHASGGDISCNFKATNIIKVSSSTYKADLNNGGNDLYVKTSGGDIVVSQQ